MLSADIAWPTCQIRIRFMTENVRSRYIFDLEQKMSSVLASSDHFLLKNETDPMYVCQIFNQYRIGGVRGGQPRRVHILYGIMLIGDLFQTRSQAHDLWVF